MALPTTCQASTALANTPEHHTDFGLCLLHAEVRRSWDVRSPRAAHLVARFGACVETLGPDRLGDEELLLALDCALRFDARPGETAPRPGQVPAEERRAALRAWVEDAQGTLAKARERLRAGRDTASVPERLSEGAGTQTRAGAAPDENSPCNARDVSAALAAASDDDGRVLAGRIFSILGPLISDQSDLVPAKDLRAAAGAVAGNLGVALPTTAVQRRRLVADWVLARRKHLAGAGAPAHTTSTGVGWPFTAQSVPEVQAQAQAHAQAHAHAHAHAHAKAEAVVDAGAEVPPPQTRAADGLWPQWPTQRTSEQTDMIEDAQRPWQGPGADADVDLGGRGQPVSLHAHLRRCRVRAAGGEAGTASAAGVPTPGLLRRARPGPMLMLVGRGGRPPAVDSDGGPGAVPQPPQARGFVVERGGALVTDRPGAVLATGNPPDDPSDPPDDGSSAAPSLPSGGAAEMSEPASERARLGAGDSAAAVENSGHVEDVGPAVPSDFLAAVLVAPGVAIGHAHWRVLGVLPRLNREWRAWAAGETAWRVRCEAIGRDALLYVPRLPTAAGPAPPVASGGRWARLFWEALFPARRVWDGVACGRGAGGAVERFKVDVCVRLKPGRRSGDGRLVLPLHQRLRLRAAGEQLGPDKAAVTIADLRASGLLREGDTLPPDVLEALVDARGLDVCSESAEAGARREQKAGRAHRVAGACNGGAENEGVEEDPVDEAADVDAQATLAAAGGDGGGRAVAESTPDTAAARDQLPAENARLASRRGMGARVLLVQPSRVVLYCPGLGLRPFSFRRVFGPDDSQAAVYEGAARTAVTAALNGLNACVLMYGQTGSGKTHTAFGPPGVLEGGALADAAEAHADPSGRAHRELLALRAVPEAWGLALRACAEVMAQVELPSVDGVRTSVTAQYLQVFGDRVFDLLGNRRVHLRAVGVPEYGSSAEATGVAPGTLPYGEGACTAVGAEERSCRDLADLLRLLAEGEGRKRYRATAMNERSSRAHTLLLLHLTRARRHAHLGAGGVSAGPCGSRRAGAVVRSDLHLVDLAGSEQLKVSGATGAARAEAVAINSSLLSLGKVVSALVEERLHVPFRESALTSLLRGSFGGSSRTTCIVTAPMADEHAEQTFQSLKFGERCSLVTNSSAVRVESLAAALDAVDEALRRCDANVAALEARGLGDSTGARRLRERATELRHKRATLGAADEGPS